MTNLERTELIQAYSRGYDDVMQSLEGFPAEALTRHLLEGKWSAAEIVHHLADSEMASALRLRKLLTEDHAVIYGYDQEQYASRLKYNSRDIGPAPGGLPSRTVHDSSDTKRNERRGLGTGRLAF